MLFPVQGSNVGLICDRVNRFCGPTLVIVDFLAPVDHTVKPYSVRGCVQCSTPDCIRRNPIRSPTVENRCANDEARPDKSRDGQSVMNYLPAATRSGVA